MIGTAPTPVASVTPAPAPTNAPAPATTPATAPAPATAATPAPASGLDATFALDRAADRAVDDALGVFGAPRRTPGAQLPTTDLFASISGSMRLGGDDTSSSGPAPASPGRAPTPSTTTPPAGPLTVTHDEDHVRSALSGFQQGTIRADREMGDH